MKCLPFIALILVLAGCMSSGRFALMDMDFRTPEQVSAGQLEAIAPYVVVHTNDVRALPEKPEQVEKSWWTKVVSWFGGMSKMRLRICPLEWSK